MTFTTSNEFTRRMKEISLIDDVEERHFEADKFLCKVLMEYGYRDGIAIYESIHKWYA